jgi:hypothetical protein
VTALRVTALRVTALRVTALRVPALHVTALHVTAIHVTLYSQFYVTQPIFRAISLRKAQCIVLFLVQG